MPLIAEIPDEHVKAGDGYTLVFVHEAAAHDPSNVWEAQGRLNAGDPVPAAIFTVDARPGANPDPVTGDNDVGNTIVTLRLPAAATRPLAGARILADLQLVRPGADPVTLLAWRLYVEQDATR